MHHRAGARWHRPLLPSLARVASHSLTSSKQPSREEKPPQAKPSHHTQNWIIDKRPAEGTNKQSERRRADAARRREGDGHEAGAEPPGSGRRRRRQEEGRRRQVGRRRPAQDGAGRVPRHPGPPRVHLRRPPEPAPLRPLLADLRPQGRRSPRSRRRRRRNAPKNRNSSEERVRDTHSPVPGQASRRATLVGVRRIHLPEPVQVVAVPEAVAVPALPVPGEEAAQVRGVPQEVRPGHAAVPECRRAAPGRAQRRQLRVQVRGVVPLQRARQPHAHHRLHLPLCAALRPGHACQRAAGAGGSLLRALPGHLLGAPRRVPRGQPDEAQRRRAGELRQHAQERRDPVRHAGTVAAGARVPPRRADPAAAVGQHLLRRRPTAARQVRVDDPQVRQLLRAGAVPDAHVREGAGKDVPAEGGGVPPPRPLPLPPDGQGVGDRAPVLRGVPRPGGREDRVPDQDLPREAGQVREHVRPAHQVHQGAAAAAGARVPGGECDRRRREGEGGADRVALLGLLRQDPGPVLREPDQDGGDGGGVPAEPRGEAGVRVQRAQPEGAGGDLPAQLLRQDRHDRLVHLRLRRLRLRRRQAVDPAPPGLGQGGVPGRVRPLHVRRAVPALAAHPRLPGQEGGRRGPRQALRPALRGRRVRSQALRQLIKTWSLVSKNFGSVPRSENCRK